VNSNGKIFVLGSEIEWKNEKLKRRGARGNLLSGSSLSFRDSTHEQISLKPIRKCDHREFASALTLRAYEEDEERLL
jgi:hypothetical protein